MTDFQRMGLDEVVRHFEELQDPRCEVNLGHPLPSVVVTALLAVRAGAGGSMAIAWWAILKQEFHMHALDFPSGIPGKDVFRPVLMALKLVALQACFPNRLQSLCTTATGVEQPFLAVDGKTARRSHECKKGLGALHSVSAWASRFGLLPGQVACAEKSNEITAIADLLRQVDPKGAITAIDTARARRRSQRRSSRVRPTMSWC